MHVLFLRIFKVRGFTLIELLVVVALISILSAIGVPSYFGYVSEAKKSKVRSDLNLIGVGLVAYRNSNGEYFFSSSTSCTTTSKHNTAIEDALLDANRVLGDEYNYCIAPIDSGSSYLISAYDSSDPNRGVTLSDKNVMSRIGDF